MGHLMVLVMMIGLFCYMAPNGVKSSIPSFSNSARISQETVYPYYDNVIPDDEKLSSGAMAVQQQILRLKPKMKRSISRSLADSIYRSSVRYGIDPLIMTSIIKVESSFNQGAVSSTGDISIAQINFEVWIKEANNLGFELSRAKLISSSDYAIDRMGLILLILKNRHSGSDPFWYGRYHSQTPYFKMVYLEKVHRYMSINKNLVADSSSF